MLVTHQRQYLSACDYIIVLHDGEIVAQGRYVQLAAAGIADVVPLAQGNNFL